MSPDRQPAPRAVDLLAGEMDGDKACERDDQQDERDTARLARRQKRQHDEDQRAQCREEDVTLDEVIGGQAFLSATDGLAASEKTRPAPISTRMAMSRNVIEGEPPPGQSAAVFAGEAHGALRRAISSATSRRK